MSEGSPIAAILITFGGLFLLGLVADLAGRHSSLPRVGDIPAAMKGGEARG